MRVFPGAFVNFDLNAAPVPTERYAPSIEVALRWEDHTRKFELLIDTGSEVSILYPHQGTALLREQFGRVVARAREDREYVGGVDGHLNRAFRIPVEMTLFDEEGLPFPFDTTILVAEPSSAVQDDSAAGGNWDTPSLLGRDLLLHFDLFVSGSTSEVYLSLPE